MELSETVSRRSALQYGSTMFSATMLSSLVSGESRASNESPRALFLVGDYWHNPITQEKNWQDVLRHAGWQLDFAQATKFVTPEELAKTDLFVVSRYAKSNNLGWAEGGIVSDRADEEVFLTDEREQAIIDNVKRGMGLLAMHCSVWNGERPKFMDLLGIEKPYMHTKVQPSFLHNINQDHPISAGVMDAKLGEDEIFYCDLIPGRTTGLFNLKGEEQPIDRTGGWCHDFGKGRVAVLLPGHTPHPFHSGSFKMIMWRSAHWAMHKEIPMKEFANGRPPERSIY